MHVVLFRGHFFPLCSFDMTVSFSFSLSQQNFELRECRLSIDDMSLCLWFPLGVKKKKESTHELITNSQLGYRDVCRSRDTNMVVSEKALVLYQKLHLYVNHTILSTLMVFLMILGFYLYSWLNH